MNTMTKVDPKAKVDTIGYEEHCLQTLRAAGYRITMPRIQVIRALADAKTALSAYAIHERIINSRGRIDVVSVYRILATLQQVGLIHHIGIVDGYFPCRIADCTGHRTMILVAEDTRNIHELALSPAVINEIEAAAAKAGFTTETVKIEVSGLKK